MGKVRRSRKKFHLEAKSQPPKPHETSISGPTPELLIKPQENLFEGVHIDFKSLNMNFDDVGSVKSFKSVKSESGKSLSKKDKLKLRREMLMKKFEVLNQQKLHDKRKKTPVVGDMNPLHDALPSLESLLKSRASIPYKQSTQPQKKKGIEKSKKIKKNQLQGIKMFQHIMKNKQFKEKPQLVIDQHLKSLLEQEKKSFN
ncbi:protein FAM207A [Tribolium madens]|uniref:protein FAM207A n=1 Tax=Tribolium madens TaxID=41895 RepID=UPI001CF736D9|nr:protein FAM207A [Tribolium madens]